MLVIVILLRALGNAAMVTFVLKMPIHELIEVPISIKSVISEAT